MVKLSKHAMKDRENIIAAGLGKKAKTLLDVIKKDPFAEPPPYEKLMGNLRGFYSRRINIKHRLVYTVHEDERVVAVRSLWTHYQER